MYSIIILFFGAAAIAVVTLAHTGVVPLDMTSAWVLAGAFVVGIVQTLWTLSRRAKSWDAYRDAGFEAGPADDSVAACAPFEFAQGYKDKCYWLPEAPEVRVYDCEEDGTIYGHLISLPTAASDGICLWGVTEGEAQGMMSHVLYHELGLGKAGEPPGAATAMPTVAGVLAVWQGRAHWAHRGRLEPDEIKKAIAALRRLPPRA